MINVDRSLFELFNNALAQKLVSTLERLYPGTKNCLLLLSKAYEPLIYNPLIYQTLRSSRVRISFVENIVPETFKPESNHITLLASHHVKTLKQLLTMLDAINNANPGRPFKFYVLIGPRRTFLTKTFLETNPFVDLFRKVKAVIDLNLDFVPLDFDTLTLAFPLSDTDFPFSPNRGYRIYNNLFKQPDFNQHLLCAEALEKLQTIFGTFEAIGTKGPAADGIHQLLNYSDLNKSKFLNPKNTIFPNLLIIDRSVDLITPLITQWTFQGLIDECTGLSFGTVRIPKRLASTDKEKKDNPETSEVIEPYYLADPNDKLYEKLKDTHWIQSAGVMRETIKSLAELRQKTGPILGAESANKAMELVKMKHFLDIHAHLQLKIENYLKSLTAMEVVKFEQEMLSASLPEYFDRLLELIQVQLPLESIIKMILLTNLCLRGLTEDQFQRLFKEMIENYGPSVLKTLLMLERQGLLVNTEDSESNFYLLKLNDLDLYKSKFKIINEEMSPNNENDLSVPFSGYTPILIRILENLINPNVKGPKVKFKFSQGASKKDFIERKTLLVFIYGGITSAELTCIRRLGRLYNKNILVLTTELVNSKTFPSSYVDDIDPK